MRSAEAVYVGDRLLEDIGGAHAAGMRAILVGNTPQDAPQEEIHPDARLSSLAELPTLLAQWREGRASTGSPAHPR